MPRATRGAHQEDGVRPSAVIGELGEEEGGGGEGGQLALHPMVQAGEGAQEDDSLHLQGQEGEEEAGETGESHALAVTDCN